MTEQHTLAIGLIGSGYMGRAHAIAFRSASAVFDLHAVVRAGIVSDVRVIQQFLEMADDFGKHARSMGTRGVRGKTAAAPWKITAFP